jgi:ABC-2 type transport system ATP-binding protein
MIRLVNVTKRFGSLTAVDNVKVEVSAGEFYGFLGPNGAGKTTTIKMITGLYAPTAGEIFINGVEIQRNPTEAKRVIGYIPDQPYVYDKLTGREYLFYSGGLYKIPKDLLRARIDELIGRFQLEAWIHRRCEEYSQGMRQRVVIASALVHNPKVIVIDEPMIGLDPHSAHIVKEILREKAREGAAVFMSTHSLPVAEELCDRVGIIKDGKIIFDDAMSALQSLKHRHDGKFESVFLELTK